MVVIPVGQMPQVQMFANRLLPAGLHVFKIGNVEEPRMAAPLVCQLVPEPEKFAPLLRPVM